MILAPLVVERKGEKLELFEELRAQGFVRVRVDAKVYDIDKVPKLAKTKKHTVEVVIDRVKVRQDIKQRMAESFETALRHADGRALAVEMDGGQGASVFRRFACPMCSYSLAELEPRLFSFNNPMGACPRCDGLGQISFFDPKRVVAFPHLSLAAGAIKGWDKRNQFYFQMIGSLAQHYGFDVDTPFEHCRKPCSDLILHGTGREKCASSTSTSAATSTSASMHSRASSPIWSDVIAKPIRSQCVRNWRNTSPASLPRVQRHTVAPRGAPRIRRRQGHIRRSAACR